MRASSIPAPYVAQHINRLRELCGASVPEVAEATGVDERTIRYILDAAPDRGVYRKTAVKILDVRRIEPGKRYRPGFPTLRRLEALTAIGYPRPLIAETTGLSTNVLRPCRMNATSGACSRVYAATETKIQGFYETNKHRVRLDQPGLRLRQIAINRGYAPPWAWRKNTIIERDAAPVLEEIEDKTWRENVARRYTY